MIIVSRFVYVEVVNPRLSSVIGIINKLKLLLLTINHLLPILSIFSWNFWGLHRSCFFVDDGDSTPPYLLLFCSFLFTCFNYWSLRTTVSTLRLKKVILFVHLKTNTSLRVSDTYPASDILTGVNDLPHRSFSILKS